MIALLEFFEHFNFDKLSSGWFAGPQAIDVLIVMSEVIFDGKLVVFVMVFDVNEITLTITENTFGVLF